MQWQADLWGVKDARPLSVQFSFSCSFWQNKILCQTRMHSSRMHTIRCSSHLQGGGLPARGCLSGGGICWGVCLPVHSERLRDRVSSSRKRFWTLPNLNSEVSQPKILLFSYWFFMQIGWRETLDTSEP